MLYQLYVPFTTENEVVLVVDVPENGPSIIDQEVEAGRPVSMNLTEYVTPDSENMIPLVLFFPLTVTDPDPGFGKYPLTDPIVYVNVPFRALTDMVEVEADITALLKLTDHCVPDGNPDSENAT